MKTVAVMQPYFFPYLGYFQLIAASSVFVSLNDVAFIRRGWINRNRFLVQGGEHMFSVPLRAASIHRSIDEIAIVEDPWRRRLIRLLTLAYARAPYQRATIDLIESVIAKQYRNIGDLADESVRAVCAHIGLKVEFQKSRENHPAGTLKGSDRILAICQSLNATRYVNSPGGKTLYDPRHFSRAGIELRFLRPVLPVYDQGASNFIPGLSIIDVLMFNTRDRVRDWMIAYELE